MTVPYGSTAVSVEKSQMDIESLLRKHHAEDRRFAYEKKTIQLRFTLMIRGEKHLLLFKVPVDFPVKKNRRNNVKRISEKQRRSEQAAWRSLYWTLKSLLETVQLKIEISDELVKQDGKIE